MDDEITLKERIYKGATRPAMKGGVPLMAMLVVFLPLAIVSLWVSYLVSPVWLLLLGPMAIAAYIYMRLVTRKDDQRLQQMLMVLRLRLIHKNAKFWQARSYTPHSPRKDR